MSGTIYSLKTPEGTSGPYDEAQLREELRAYSESRGEEATVREVVVFEATEGSTNMGRLDVRQFL